MENLLEATAAVLKTTPVYWLALCETLPPAVLTAPPKAGEWSALECLQHLVDTEINVFPVRVRCFLAGQDFPAFDPDSQGSVLAAGQSPAALAAEFARLRRANLELLAALTPADLPRQARHGGLGPVTLSELLHEWAAHELMHTIQGQHALMQPFIQGSGPWQVYFTDHTA